MKKFGSKSGFTLVELIVVIAILGILAGIAVPAYSGYIKKANQAADYTQLDAIKTAAVFAYTDKQVKDGNYDAVDIATIVVTAKDGSNNGSVTVTPVVKEGETATTADVTDDMQDYYDVTNFEFKSNTSSATWRKTAVAAGTGTPATPGHPAGWELTPKTTTP